MPASRQVYLINPFNNRQASVKPSIWDLFSAILFAASFVLVFVFYRIYQDPTSQLNPFPPPTPAETLFVPTLTPSSIALPEIWTPDPEPQAALENAAGDGTRDQAEPVEPATITPVLLIPTQSVQSLTKTAGQPKQPGIMLPTKNPLAPTPKTIADDNTLIITAPIGVFNNTWQNIQSIPAFSWNTSQSIQEIDHFLLYFGIKQNGRLTIKTVKMNYNHAAVPSGIYYFRLVAIGKNGAIIGAPSSFLFKYDDTPPTPPTSLTTESTGDTNLPLITWKESKDAHSGMIGGLAGYSIYQGSSNRCGKPVAFTTVPYWTPVTPVAVGSTEYFCVKALDAVGNESKWTGPLAYTYSN